MDVSGEHDTDQGQPVGTFWLQPIRGRSLLYFWRRDPDGHPLLALLCAYARDPILRMSAPFILPLPEGITLDREALAEHIEAQEPGRFSRATLQSTTRNLSSTWTQSGHLSGRARKVRTRAAATLGSAAYALLLGYLTGARGQSLFTSEYARLLDASYDQVLEQAESAARRGWIVLKRIGDVVEVLFPNLLNAEEQEWSRGSH